MCKLLGVSASGYYAWKKRPLSLHAAKDIELGQKIKEIHARSRGTYGAPRVHAELKFIGDHTSKKRVQRLMKEQNLSGVTRRRWSASISRDEIGAPAPDLVQRKFEADRPNKLWIADITYVPTWEGFLYLSVVMDVYSRKIVGWSMEAHLRTDLVLSALTMALN